MLNTHLCAQFFYNLRISPATPTRATTTITMPIVTKQLVATSTTPYTPILNINPPYVVIYPPHTTY